jgi:N-acetylglucosamine kinase-like BadF-type ATPase
MRQVRGDERERMARLIGVDVGGTKVSVAVLEDGRLSSPS